MPTVSSRTRNLGTEHAFVVLAEVNQLIAQGRDIISFAIGQPDFVTPANIREAAKRAMDEGKTGYTASAGIPELRQAVAAYLSETRGVGYSADDITVANGAKPFIMYSILAVTDHGAGHEVLYPSPGFPIYESQITACGAVPVALPLLEREAFSFDLADLRAKLNANTRLLILNSPHNPTGRTLNRDELAAIAGVLADYPEAWVFSDEVYSRMMHDGEFVSIASLPSRQRHPGAVLFHLDHQHGLLRRLHHPVGRRGGPQRPAGRARAHDGKLHAPPQPDLRGPGLPAGHAHPAPRRRLLRVAQRHRAVRDDRRGQCRGAAQTLAARSRRGRAGG